MMNPLRTFRGLMAAGLCLAPLAGARAQSPDAAAVTNPPAASQWIDANWVDPDILLTNVDFSGSLRRVHEYLQAEFKDKLNILPLPDKVPDRISYFMSNGGLFSGLHLHNVHASDLFRAMNMVFEDRNIPLRWELRASGRLVRLRVLPEAAETNSPSAQKTEETLQEVIFVGDLFRGGKNPEEEMQRLFLDIRQTVSDNITTNPNKLIQLHPATQIIIINGTRSEVALVRQVLQALKQKAEWERSERSNRIISR